MGRQPRFGHTATETLYAYWERKRAGRPAPDRSEIEPGEIRAILPETFILEVDPTRGYAWRLAGTKVCALHCRELKGRTFATDWEGKERATMLSLLDAVVRDSSVAVVQFRGTSDRGKPLDAEMVLLPLRVFGRPTCRVLGAIGTLDPPYWLGIAPPKHRAITGVRMIWPTGTGGDPTEPPAIVPDAAAAHAALGGNEATRRYRHLVVLDGGRR